MTPDATITQSVELMPESTTIPKDKKHRRRELRENLILVFLILNFLFAVYNHRSHRITQTLLDARAVVQTDLIRIGIINGTITTEQKELYRENWKTTGYDRVAPVEMLDNPSARY